MGRWHQIRSVFMHLEEFHVQRCLWCIFAGNEEIYEMQSGTFFDRLCAFWKYIFRESCVLTVSKWSRQQSVSLIKVNLSKCGNPIVSGNLKKLNCLCVCVCLFAMMKNWQLFDYRSLFPIFHLRRSKHGMADYCKHSGFDALRTLSYAILGLTICNLCRHIYIESFLPRIDSLL